ncbi:MAG: hypothetical protein ACP5TL_03170 [Candidatus Micrarchaeia archaeon]
MQRTVKDGTYLITNDLVLKTESVVGPLPERLKAELKSLGDEFVKEFWHTAGIPESVATFELDGNNIRDELEGLLRETNYPIVSLDRVYITPKTPGVVFYIDVTRLTDPNTGTVKLAPRPGKKPIDEQIKELKNLVDDSPVALVDIGVFEGNTLLTAIDAMRRGGVSISEIYLGVSSRGFESKVGGKSKVSIANMFDLFEWIELRDLVGMDGRKVGLDQNGVLEYMPYWEDLEEWASVPKENVSATKRLCIKYYNRITDILAKEGYDIKAFGKPVELKTGILDLVRGKKNREQAENKVV